MKNASRARKEHTKNKRGPNQPIVDKDEIQNTNDERIDEDFPGYPHHPSKEADLHNGSGGAFEGTENPGRA
jgi:hypothetical protein